MEEIHKKSLCNNWGSSIFFIANLLNFVLATAVFTIPFPMHEVGIILGTIILTVTCFISVIACTFIIEALALKTPTIINDIPIGNFEIEYLNSIESEYAVLDKDELIKIIKYYSINYPNDSLNWIDVSWITDMYELFKNTIYNKNNYNGDISKWDVSNVNSMEDMFLGSGFNQDISKWDVSNVTNMHGMFCNSKFNKDISKWDVSNVESMSYMFHGA